jgi:hypothetical protein
MNIQCNENLKIKDMPKIECPFIRKLLPNRDYILTPDITPEYNWVFDDESVEAIEKLDGTNVSIVIFEGQVVSVWNRTERIPFVHKGKKWISEGILNSYERGYMDLLPDGQHFGELIGPKVNGNPYKLKEHLWIPFQTFAKNHLKYKSWGKYPKDFQTISNWFKELIPLYSSMVQGEEGRKNGFVEGVVFTHPVTGQMAKLRRDMFDWFKDKKHKE